MDPLFDFLVGYPFIIIGVSPWNIEPNIIENTQLSEKEELFTVLNVLFLV